MISAELTNRLEVRDIAPDISEWNALSLIEIQSSVFVIDL